MIITLKKIYINFLYINDILLMRNGVLKKMHNVKKYFLHFDILSQHINIELRTKTNISLDKIYEM